MVDNTLHQRVLAVVEPLALKLQQMQQESLASHIKGGEGTHADIATNADEYSDQYLRAELPKLQPGSWVVSEETAVELGAEIPEYTWIVDPIDGTVNYAHRLPFYGISIALYKGGQAVYALIYLPSFNQYVAAGEDRQVLFKTPTAFIPREAGLVPYVTVAKSPNLAPSEHGQVIQALCEALRTPRDLGSTVYQAYLAVVGHVDCSVMYNVAIWDMAAAVYLADCAGLETHYWSDPLAVQLHPQSETSTLAAYKQRLAIGRSESIDAVKHIEW